MKLASLYRSLSLAISSPVHPLDNISLMHDDGDQRVVRYRCPACGERFPFLWEHVTGRGRGETPLLACSSCGVEHDEVSRRRMLRSAKWFPTAEAVDEDTISFSLSRLDSRRSSLEEVCRSYRRAVRREQRGDPAGIKAFTNLVLGRPREEGADVDAIMRNLEATFDLAPVVQLCCGIDVMADRLVYVVAGFDGGNREVWIVDGPPNSETTWAALDSRISQPHGGHRVSIVSADAGWSTADVLKACSRRRLWLPVVGRQGRGAPIARRLGPTGIATVGKTAANSGYRPDSC